MAEGVVLLWRKIVAEELFLEFFGLLLTELIRNLLLRLLMNWFRFEFIISIMHDNLNYFSVNLDKTLKAFKNENDQN